MMASTTMDETMSETERTTEGAPVRAEEAPQPLPASEFDATPWPVPSRPAPRLPRISKPLGPRMWTAALAGALLFTAGGLAILYLDDATFQNTANQVNSQNKALQAQNKSLA